MSARMGLLAQLSLRMDAIPAHQLIREYRAEVLHETPLFLAEFDSVESTVHLTLDDARDWCDDIAEAVANGQCWDWSRNEDGVYVQFWTHEDDDRPLHMTGGTVTEIRVQRPEVEQGKQDTREPEPLPYTEARAAFMQIGTTHSLEGLRTELHIEGHPPIVGSYCGAGMRRSEAHDGVLFIEPMLAFEYAEPAEGGDAE